MADNGPRLTPLDITDPDDDPCGCFDPEHPTPTSPERDGDGNAFGGNEGVSQVQIVGVSGIDASENPVVSPVKVMPSGALLVELVELPRGLTGTERMASGTVRTYVNGRLITFTSGGSGDTFTNA